MRKFHVKKGDLVQVNAGEDRKKQGKVLEVDPKKERAIVEGINMISKHVKPSSKYPQGGIVKKEAPIHISNLNVVDPTTGKPTRVGRKRVEVEVVKDGKTVQKTKSVRYAKKSGTELK
jgi:large subunit ribosomal protein L24